MIVIMNVNLHLDAILSIICIIITPKGSTIY